MATKVTLPELSVHLSPPMPTVKLFLKILKSKSITKNAENLNLSKITAELKNRYMHPEKLDSTPEGAFFIQK
jgi:hypothetical protein